VLSQEAFGSSIVHNHIHHLFYTGVSTGWTWGYAADSDAGQTVGWNHIHDIFQRELSDGGCVYNLGRSPGTRIINNVCHDVESYGYGGWGLYTDEGSSNVTLRDNIVYHTKDAGFHQHYGTVRKPLPHCARSVSPLAASPLPPPSPLHTRAEQRHHEQHLCLSLDAALRGH
jgi:hypothetical protein